MRCRCPHCHNPIEIVADDPLTDIECPSCGSTFQLVGEPCTTSYHGKPNTIAQFELLQPVGAGKFGSVWKARDTELDRIVAVKIPRAGQLEEAESQQFLREARAAAQVKHPNVVSVHEVGRQDGTIYIVSDFIDGAHLKDYVSGQRLSFREAAELCATVADALHAAHEAGVIHRDLKPQNIMMDADGTPHVADFGLAKREAGEITMTVDGQILGTPAYMPPEQIEKAHEVDRRADVYSLGVILYELLTGELPFRGQRQMVLLQIQRDEPTQPRKLNNHIPKDLETICLKCLEKNPSNRYPSAAVLDTDLRRFIGGEPVHARRVSKFTRGWRWARRNPAAAALMAVSFFTLVVSAIAVVSVLAGLSINSRFQVERKHSSLLRSQQQAARGVSFLERGDSFGLLSLLEARRTAEGIAEASDSRSWLWSGWHAAHAGRLLQVVGDDNEKMSFTQFSPDATRLVTVADDGTVQLWDPLSGRPIGSPIPGRRVGDLPWRIVAFTDKGKSLVTVSKEGVLGLYDTHNGQSRDRFFQHDRNVLCVAASSDGELLASGGSSVRVWQIATGKRIGEELKLFDAGALALAFSPDNRWLAVGLSDATVILCDVATGRQHGPVLKHTPGELHRVSVVAFSPDGRFLASGSRDNTARLWEVSSGHAVGEEMWHKEDLWDLAFSPDGSLLATASFDGTAQLWNVPTGTKHGGKLQHRGVVTRVAFSPNGDLLATASYDGTARLWNTETSDPHGLPVRHQGIVSCVSFSPKGDRLATSSADGSARIWSVNIGEPTMLGKLPSRVYSVAFGRNDKFIAAGMADGKVVVWNVETSERLAEIIHPSNQVTSVAFSPDGNLLAAAGGTCVQLWETKTWHTSGGPLPPQRYSPRVITFSPDGTLLAGSDAGVGVGSGVLLWNLASRHSVKRLPPTTGFEDVRALAFSPDGRCLASGGVDKTVKLWRINGDEAQLSHSLDLPGQVEALSFSPDGKVLATASNDTIRLWDPETGQSIAEPLRQPAQVQSLAFWPGRGPHLLAAVYADGTARLLDTITGLPCGPSLRHTLLASSVNFSDDGRLLATGSFDGTVHLWKTPPHVSNLADIEQQTHVTLGAQLTEEAGIMAIPWRQWQELSNQLRP